MPVNPGRTGIIFQVLRTFWLTEVTLILVAIYGLYSGWSTPRQWSDGLFLAAAAQLMIGGISFLGSSRDYSYAFLARYVTKGDVTETQKQLGVEMLRQQSFGKRAFLGGLLTLLIAWLALRF
ncbi:MAG TPA: hypothetical protein DEQ80_06795 [Anaerolinea thermolimosa]|uniref:Uncharacterized protein n=1 Tax=Anaerolinea thermolimosa TaxID=229919 RepID=A0A3D1JG42_9CHLR|nr:hypothetical protein [Anaerolinea thermolimosa]HCE17549.1 hypothetical protein [Anaerolinea thermolimosa]